MRFAVVDLSCTQYLKYLIGYIVSLIRSTGLYEPCPVSRPIKEAEEPMVNSSKDFRKRVEDTKISDGDYSDGLIFGRFLASLFGTIRHFNIQATEFFIFPSRVFRHNVKPRKPRSTHCSVSIRIRDARLFKDGTRNVVSAALHRGCAYL